LISHFSSSSSSFVAASSFHSVVVFESNSLSFLPFLIDPKSDDQDKMTNQKQKPKDRAAIQSGPAKKQNKKKQVYSILN